MAKTVMRGRISESASAGHGQARIQDRISSNQSKIVDSWEKILSDFLMMKQAQGLRERTLRDYRNNVTLFFKKFPDAFESEEKLLSSVYQYMAQKLKPASYNLYLIYLKAYFNYCVKRGVIWGCTTFL